MATFGRSASFTIERQIILMRKKKLEEELNRYFSEMERKPPFSEKTFAEDEVFMRIQEKISYKEKRYYRRFRWIRVAASIVIFFALGMAWYLWQRPTNITFETVSFEEHPILPGGQSAILTLADGSKISLDSLGAGSFTTTDGIEVIVDNDGNISYQQAKNTVSNTPKLHRIEIPKSAQYSLQLPDGTKVWLNSLSQIRYPIKFTGPQRRVELIGEAYFEVVHSPDQPFIVVTAQQEINVLGTSFNVCAYPSESEQTTLVRGSVKVLCGESEVTLKPGQQALASTSGLLTTQTVDTHISTAWKDGDFSFQNTPIKEIMNQLSRWYDVDVVYQDLPNDLRLSGMVSRSRQLDTVIDVLEMTGKVKFSLEINQYTKERRIKVKGL